MVSSVLSETDSFFPLVLTQALLLLSYVIVQLCQRIHKLAQEIKQHLLYVTLKHYIAAVRQV